MKKNSKKTILFNLLLIATVAVFVLGYVGVKLKFDILTKDKVLLERDLMSLKNSKINLLAEKQSLSSEGRIVEIAKQKLKMVTYLKPDKTIEVQESRIKELSKKLRGKYE